MNHNIYRIQDVAEGAVYSAKLERQIRKGSAVLLRGRSTEVALGRDLLVKVCTNLGVSNGGRYKSEIAKLEAVVTSFYRPDAVMDLSIRRMRRPLYEIVIQEHGVPVGTLPHYLCYHSGSGFDKKELLDEVGRQAEAGVAWMTIHPTPGRDILELAGKTRLTPYIARGGGLVVRDLLLKRREQNVFQEIFDDILIICKEHNMVISIGATFRPATTVDALDDVHLMELKRQLYYVDRARAAGVGVILEGVGHITLNKLRQYVRLVKAHCDIPFVPLGPMPTDAAIGEDHIVSAIGASFMGMMGGAGMIHSVTREEHTGNVPTTRSVLEGLRAARIAAHVVNIAKFPKLDRVEKDMRRRRGNNYTCVVDGGLFSKSSQERFALGCKRCSEECPLLIDFVHKRFSKQLSCAPSTGEKLARERQINRAQ